MKSEIFACCRKTPLVVWTSADEVGILVILAIVLPEADWTNLVVAPTVEGFITAARTVVSGNGLVSLPNIAKEHLHCEIDYISIVVGMILMQDGEVGLPWAYGFAVLVGLGFQDLVDVAEIVDGPGGDQLA